MQHQLEISYHQKRRCVVSLIVTLGIIYFVKISLIILPLLLVFWFFCFHPWEKKEIIMFIVASVFFLGQNYMVLKGGGFSFKHQDILLMPYYEPFLWGFYFINIKRFISESPGVVCLSKRAALGLIVTGLGFSLFPDSSNMTLVSTVCSTCLLFVMFHERHDFYYAAYTLIFGFVIEIFGVTSGLWGYPEPDVLGIPYWFATMWISVGVLGRRFLIPLAEWLSIKIS